MPQHYGFGLDFEFENYEEQRRQLERLRQTVPSAVNEARRFTETFYGTKQTGPCRLLPDAELTRRCRQGISNTAYPSRPYSVPGDNGPISSDVDGGMGPNGGTGNGNGNGNGGNGGGDG